MMTISILTIIFLCPSYSIKINKIENPILPLQIGKAHIVESEHIFLYHVNISIPFILISQIHKQIISLNVFLEKHSNHYSLQLSQKLDIANKLCTRIHNKAANLHPLRNKRAIFDGIGIASKYLFGTMDSNDEIYINKYLEALNKNEVKLQTSLSNQQTILEEIINNYENAFVSLHNNQKQILSQLNNLIANDAKIREHDEIISLDLTIDRLILELQMLLEIITNIETSVTFSKLHVLHTATIQTENIQEILQKLGNNAHFPKFNHVLSYYSLFSSDSIIMKDIILFKIHVPLLSQPYNYFQLFPVYQTNFTLIPEAPFFLFDENEYWHSERRCSTIEDIHICDKKQLTRGQPCMRDILVKGKIHCPLTRVKLTETLIQRISPTKLLINPSRPTTIRSTCPEDGLLIVADPTLIEWKQCTLEIDGEKFRPQEASQEEHIFSLPALNISLPIESNQRTLHISRINEKHIKNIKILADNLIKEDTTIIQSKKHTWTNTILIIIFLTTIIGIFVYQVWSKIKEILRRRREAPEARTIEENQEPPIFFPREGGVI